MVPVIDPGRRSPSSVIWRSTLLRCASSPGSVSDIGDTSSTLSVLYTFRQEAQKKATPHILTPVSRAPTFLLLGLGFYFAYRKPKHACEPGGACEKPATNKTGRIGLWVATAVVLIVAAFP